MTVEALIRTPYTGVATRGQPEPSRLGVRPYRGPEEVAMIKAIETRYKGYRFRQHGAG